MNGHSAPHTPPAPPSPPSVGFFDSVRRLGIWRSTDRWAGGVAAGIGRRYGLDPLLVRGLFVVVTLFGGLGLVLYGLAWALLPEETDGRIHLEEAVRGRFDIALAGAAAVLVIGLSRPVFWWGAAWWSAPWVLAVVAVVVLVIATKDRDTTTAPPAPGTPPPFAAGPTTAPPPPAPPRPAYDVPEDAMPQTTAPATGETSSTEVTVSPTLPMIESATRPLSADTTTEDVPGPTEPTEPAAPGTTAPGEGSWHGGGAGWHSGAAWHGGSAAGGDGGAGWSGGQAPPPQPPQPPRPPVPGPGSRTTSLVLAISLLGAAGVALAHQQGVLDANPWLIGGGGVLAVLGAGVLVSGIRGRSQGGIGVVALLVALVMVPAAAAAATLPGFARFGADATTWAGDPTWVPRTAEEAEGGYSLVAGQLVVDLTELDEDATLPVSVTFGNLTLVVPEDADVTVNAEVTAGEIVGPLDDDWSGPGAPWWGSTRSDDSITNGAGISTTLVQEGDGRGPEIVVDAAVTFGQLYIEETS
ncbi:PspC domain-containing protein [Oceanitalea stevensii]|uniref:PspC domain-containing protein n=1 Tax=Oceanitalea stevensii TaxID=2763072 RepID=A0ABR8YZQ8_9MICO|nr:PspC domain-containing protein [Oceanitalea stevensii]MBD8061535.1 PspC domain-containing protein [Oceanitalea stevensii]